MIKYYLNGIECNPKESRNIRFSLDFTLRNFNDIRMSVSNIVFVREDKEACLNWINTYGYLVGMPFDVLFSNGVTRKYVLDWTDTSFSITDERVTVSAYARGENEAFFPKADGLTFTNSDILSWSEYDFVKINYLVITPDIITQLITTSTVTLLIGKEVAESIERTVEGTNAVIKATTPVGVPPAPDWGALIIVSLKLAAIVAYTITIIIAFVNLIVDIVNYIFPKVRQFKAIDYFKLIEKGCNALGYEFESTLLESLKGLTILPVPLRDKDANFFKEVFTPNTLAYTNGYPSARDTSCSTLGRAINQIEHIFNAEARVVDNLVRLEKKEYFESIAIDDMELAFNLQESMENSNGINSEDFYKRKLVIWENDSTDFNTLDDTKDTIAEYSTDVGTTPAPDLDLTKGYNEVRVDFARATQKKDLTVVEDAVKVLAKLVDVFTGGGAASSIESRKKVMIISQLFFNKTKLLIRNGQNLADNQNSLIGATAIGNLHSDTFIQNNLKKIYEEMPLRMNEEYFFKIRENNFVNLEDGSVAEILTLDWSEEEAEATATYTVKSSIVNATTTKIA
jgi:hypothetical protein